MSRTLVRMIITGAAALAMVVPCGLVAQGTAQASRPAARTQRPGPEPSGGGETVAIVNARVLPVSAPAIERGTVLIRGGRIAAVGADVQIPARTRIIEAAGKIVTPGWIESATQIGIVEIPTGAEGSDDQASTDKDLSAAFNVVDSFNGDSTVIPVTRVEGITRAVVMPVGTGHAILGQGAMVELSGAQVPDALVKAPIAMFANLGEAGAASEGGSRASAMLRLREALQDALDFARNRAAWNAAQRRPYARGRLDLEALVPVVRGELPLALNVNRASDLLAAMRLADQFHLKLILMGAAEGWRIAPQLAARKVPVVVKPLTDIPGFDALGATLENPARLARAGVTLVLSSFDTHNARNLRQEAGNAIAYGLDRDAALRAVTLEPARVWGVADRLGSIEVGKQADLVVWSGDPFELTTGAERVFIGGREMSADTRQKQLFEKYRVLR